MNTHCLNGVGFRLIEILIIQRLPLRRCRMIEAASLFEDEFSVSKISFILVQVWNTLRLALMFEE